jgi:hypothetical protein
MQKGNAPMVFKTTFQGFTINGGNPQDNMPEFQKKRFSQQPVIFDVQYT